MILRVLSFARAKRLICSWLGIFDALDGSEQDKSATNVYAYGTGTCPDGLVRRMMLIMHVDRISERATFSHDCIFNHKDLLRQLLAVDLAFITMLTTLL